MDSKPRCLVLFEESCKSKATKKNYKLGLDRFLKWAKKDYESFLILSEDERQVLLEDYTIYVKRRLNPNSVPKVLQGPQKFLKANRVKYDKEALEGLFPEEIKSGGERAITTEEIQRMLRFTSSKRVKALIHLLSATGHRPEALADLMIKDMSELSKESLCLVAYRNSKNEHEVFCHSEAKKAIEEYLEERKAQGEKLTSDSYLLAKHDLFKQGIDSKPLIVQAVDSMIGTVMKKAKIERIKRGNRFDLAVCGGFRKRFNTILKSNPNISYAIAERLMDHKTNLEPVYLHTPKERLFSEYEKAIPELMVDQESRLREESKKKDVTIEKFGYEAKNEIESMKRELHAQRIDTLKLIGDAIKDPEKFKKLLSEFKDED